LATVSNGLVVYWNGKSFDAARSNEVVGKTPSWPSPPGSCWTWTGCEKISMNRDRRCASIRLLSSA